MKPYIFLLGAGKSSSVLINYLLNYCEKYKFRLFIVTQEIPTYLDKNNSHLKVVCANVFEEKNLSEWIKDSLMVISMLPAHLHIEIAKTCLKHNKHFLTASYVSKEMKLLHDEVQKKGLIFLNECGLDPGLDHLSAMRLIHSIKTKGAKIIGFESFTGGLIAPAYDNNPWNYKLTWNPRNVVLAGQGGVAKFKQSGTFKYIPYQQLFRRTEMIHIPGYGKFEGYANRDSLSYGELYGLEDIDTLFRGTLRRPGFCKAWNKLILLGMTDDSYTIPNSDKLTKRQFTNLFLAYHPTDSVELKFQRHLQIEQDDFDIMEKMEYLGLFSQEPILLKNATPAQILQSIIEEKWRLEAQDKDMIVMWHKFTFELAGKTKEIQSSLVVEGKNQSETAMAITVGLPLAIACKLILENKIFSKGVLIPVHPEIYQPILKEIEQNFHLAFVEKEI